MQLMLHGALGSAAQFNALLALKPSGAEAVALNFPGHGKAPADEPFSMEYFGASVLRYMDENGLGRARLCGYSMGGYVALWMAWKYPDRIEAVKTYGTKLEWNPEVAAGMSRMFDPEKIAAKAPALAESLAAIHGAGEWENLCRLTAGFLNRLGQGEGIPEEAFSRISCPVTIGWGNLDNVVGEAESRRVSELISGANFWILDGGKHLLEQTDVQALKAYVF